MEIQKKEIIIKPKRKKMDNSKNGDYFLFCRNKKCNQPIYKNRSHFDTRYCDECLQRENMRRLKRVKVYIRGEELLLTPKQLFIKLRKLNFWDMEEFLENNSTDLFNDFTFKLKIIEEIENIHDQIASEYNERRLDNMEYHRQMERTSSDMPIYPHGWYEKEDNQIIKGEK